MSEQSFKVNEQSISLDVGTIDEQKFPNLSGLLRSIRPSDEELLGKAKTTTSIIQAAGLIRSCTESMIREVAGIIHTRILKNEILGDADDFHNIAVEFSRKNMPAISTSICQHGIEIWKDSIDLNADALNYAMDAGKTTEAAAIAKQLEINCPDRSKWNWRGFKFLLNYYLTNRPEGFEKKASVLIQDFKRYLPHEEKAYTSDASRLVYAGKFTEAMNVLEEAVSKLNAPQCALTLADMYFERAKYEDAIRVATLGIAYSAEPQPGIRVPYLIFLRAMAKDALYLKSGRNSQEEAHAIIREYELAKKYVSSQEERIVDMRIDILKTYAGIPLDSE